eukprot:642353-Hanusia_phi.AAC.10
MKQLGEALALDDRDIVVWIKLGGLAMQMNKYNVSRYAYEQGLRLRPNHPVCLEKLSEVAYILGDWSTSQASITQLEAHFPFHPRAKRLRDLLDRDLLEADSDNPEQDVHLDNLKDLRRKRQCVEPVVPTCLTLLVNECSWLSLLYTLTEILDSDVLRKHPCPNVQVITNEPNIGKISPTKSFSVRSIAVHFDFSERKQDDVYLVEKSLCLRCGGDDETGDCLLLCENYDSCGEAYHLSCLDAPLKELPAGKWFCQACLQKKAGASHRAKPEESSSNEQSQSMNSLPPPEVLHLDGSRDSMACSSPGKSPRYRRRSKAADSSLQPRKTLRRTCVLNKPVAAESLQNFLDLVAQNVLAGETIVPVGQSESAPNETCTPSGPVDNRNPNLYPSSLSRVDILQHVKDFHQVQEEEFLSFMESLPNSLCIWELIYRAVNHLAILSSKHRVRQSCLPSPEFMISFAGPRQAA